MPVNRFDLNLQLLWPILCSFGRPQAPQCCHSCRSCCPLWSSIRRQWFNLAQEPNKRPLRELKETATAADDDRIVGPNPRATCNLQRQLQQRQQKQMCLYIVTKLTLITRSPGLCGKRKYAKQLVAATPATSSNNNSSSGS